MTPGQPDAVVETALRFAQAFGAELVCAHVDTGRYAVGARADGSVRSLPFDPDAAKLEDGEVDVGLTEHLARLLEAATNAGVGWSTRALAREPAQALGQLAETIGAELIVVGSRERGARGGLREFLAGSVAAHLAHRQGRPVVIVPLDPTASEAALPWETR